MTDESIQPSLLKRVKTHWRCAIWGLFLIGILTGLVGLGYHSWLLNQQLTEQDIRFNSALSQLQQQEKNQINTLATQQSTLETWQTKQQQLVQQVQKLAVKTVSSSSMGGVLGNLTNQIAVIQLLISNQQYALAINLLATMETELALLPESQRQTVSIALAADLERLQQVQTSVQQLLGQLQQLQQHINQQLLMHFGPANSEVKSLSVVTDSLPSDSESFFAEVKQQLFQAVQIQHTSVQADPVLPAFYSGVMLQLALYQAQFALAQGNWMEFQLALTAVQAWLTPATLSWLPDMASVMQTIASLSQQPPAFSTVNVSATQQALVKITQELAQ